MVRADTAALTLPLRLPLWPLAWAGLASMAVIIALGGHGLDGQTFYAARPDDPYWGPRPEDIPYVYSPAFLVVTEPLKWLGWQAFHLILVGAGVIALAYLVGPWLALGALLFQVPIVTDDLMWANVYLVTAAMLVLAVKHPAAWAWPLLTKVTAGVGILYHLGKRDWHSLDIGIGVTLIIFALSAMVVPYAWVEWPGFLMQSEAAEQARFVPMPIRLAVAAGVAWYAGHSDRPWMIGLAAFLAAPQPANAGAYLLTAWRLRG